MRAYKIILQFGAFLIGYNFVCEIAEASVDAVYYFSFIAHHPMDSFSADTHLLPCLLSQINLEIICYNWVELLDGEGLSVKQKSSALFLHILIWHLMYEVVICLLTDLKLKCIQYQN